MQHKTKTFLIAEGAMIAAAFWACCFTKPCSRTGKISSKQNNSRNAAAVFVIKKKTGGPDDRRYESVKLFL